MNPIKDAITLVGSVTEFAHALGVTPQAVCFWRDGRRKIPADKCPLIERVTGGIVTCEALRPDVDWSYIRGTANVQQPPAPPAIKTVVNELVAIKSTEAEAITDQLLSVAAQAGLIERRSFVRRAEDRAMREALNTGKVA